jgi:hypothetical protein
MKLSEAVFQLDQDRTSMERSDSNIRESELATEDVLSPRPEEPILDRFESLKESLVCASSDNPPAQAGLDLVAHGIREEPDLGFAQGILGQQVRLRSNKVLLASKVENRQRRQRICRTTCKR